MDDINLGLYPQPRLCPLGLTTSYVRIWCACLHCGASLDSFSLAVAISNPTPTSRPPPQLHWSEIGAHLQKRPEIA